MNTIQPAYQPYAPNTPDANRLPPLTNPTIGDRLSGAGIDWAWYSGGWSNAAGNVGAPGWTNGNGATCSDPDALATATFPNCPDKLFQFHHQPLNYFRSFAPGSEARAQHLRDEQEFLDLATSSEKACALKPVSFVKPAGAENEHPGYASVSTGSDHLVDLLKAIGDSRCAKHTMVVVTYDEFGGQWDHVPPPGRPAARRAERPARARHACAGARPDARPEGRFRHGPHAARHDVRAVDDRAALRPAAALEPGRRGAVARVGVRSEGLVGAQDAEADVGDERRARHLRLVHNPRL